MGETNLIYKPNGYSGEILTKRPLTLGYVFFYILFLPDSWQILIGIIAACILAPRAIGPQTGMFGSIMLYLMIATIGYAASRLPSKGITRLLKRIILSGRQAS